MPEASHRWVKKSVLESGKGNFLERTNWVDQSKLDPLKILLRNIGPSERPFEDFNSGPRRGWPVEHVRVLVEKNMVPQRSLIMSINKERRKVCQFLLGLGTATLALFLFPVSLFSRQKEFPYANVASRKSSTPSANRKSKIVMARSDLVQTQEAKINGEVARQMVHEGMKKLAGTPTLSSAWKSFFGPDDIVGIKVNCLGGNMLPPHVEVVMAVVDGLKSAGIVEEDIIIWDRSTSELKRAGFKINVRGRGVRCFGTDMVGYDRQPEIKGSIGSCFSKIVSTYCSALISVPVLKDHDLAGISISMKNFYGAIHNPNKYHDNNCDPYIADLNSHPYIKEKLRLVICDGIIGVYHGGPSYKARWSWNYNGLLISQDPVAVDSMGRRIIEEKRKEMGLGSLTEAGREPKYIATAAKLGLGIDNPKEGEVITFRL